MKQVVRGLTTLAFLKAELDAGRDHVSIFQPIVTDAVHSLEVRDFTVPDIQELIVARTGIDVPGAYISTLLRRMTRRGALERSEGRYTRLGGAGQEAGLEERKAAIGRDLMFLGRAFGDYVRSAGPEYAEVSDERGLEMLADFVRQYRASLMLEEAVPAQHSAATKRERRLARHVAQFITNECLESDSLRPILRSLVEGIVLQDVLLLRDVAQPEQRFRDLLVALDTPVLLALNGLTGRANESAVSYGVTLLRDCGARIAVFHDTVEEANRILRLYEERMGSTDGRLSLWLTPLTQYMLQARLSPTDINVVRTTLAARTRNKGVEVIVRPERDARYTLNEKDLEVRLADRTTRDTSEPRVLHDVNCVAAVLTLRRGFATASLERSRAIFSTTAGRVIRTINTWFEESAGSGHIPPLIHHEQLTALAWLKKPATASGLQLLELAVVCNAILMPTRQTWDACTAELRRLLAEGVITDDETAVLVASGLLEPALTEFEDSDEPYADTMAQAVERGREGMHAAASEAAQEGVRTAQVEADAATARAAKMERRIARIAVAIGRTVRSIVFVVPFGAIAAAAFISMSWIDDALGAKLSPSLRNGLVIIAAVIAVLATVYGFNLRSASERIGRWAEERIREALGA